MPKWAAYLKIYTYVIHLMIRCRFLWVGYWRRAQVKEIRWAQDSIGMRASAPKA